MKKWNFYLALGWFLLQAHLFSAQAFEIHLVESIATAEPKIFLGDITKIENKTQNPLLEKLEQIYICEAPQVGFVRQLEQSFIWMKLRQSGVDVTGLELKGPKLVLLKRKEGILSKKEQVRAIHAWVSEEIQLPQEEFRLQMKTRIQDLRVPFGKVVLQFEGQKKTLSGVQTGIVMKIYIDGKFYKRKGLNFQLLLSRHIVVATKDLKKGQKLERGAFQMISRFVSMEDKTILDSIEMAEGFSLKKDVARGEVLRRDVLSTTKLVRRGDVVECRIQSKNMKMAVTLEVMEDGLLGDTVRLINRGTNKTVMARVTGEKQVEIIL